MIIFGAAIGAIVGTIFIVISAARHERRYYDRMKKAEQTTAIATTCLQTLMRDGAVRCQECYCELGPHYASRGLYLMIDEKERAHFWCAQHPPEGMDVETL